MKIAIHFSDQSITVEATSGIAIQFFSGLFVVPIGGISGDDTFAVLEGCIDGFVSSHNDTKSPSGLKLKAEPMFIPGSMPSHQDKNFRRKVITVTHCDDIETLVENLGQYIETCFATSTLNAPFASRHNITITRLPQNSFSSGGAATKSAYN